MSPGRSEIPRCNCWSSYTRRRLLPFGCVIRDEDWIPGVPGESFGNNDNGEVQSYQVERCMWLADATVGRLRKGNQAIILRRQVHTWRGPGDFIERFANDTVRHAQRQKQLNEISLIRFCESSVCGMWLIVASTGG